MITIKVSSSQIKLVQYDKEDRELYIAFNNDKVYKYFDVSQDTFSALILAESAGKFFLENIKSKYKYELITK